MAYEIPGLSFTLVAAGDLSASQFRAVTTDVNGKAVLPGAGTAIIGVLQNKPKTNEAATIVADGIVFFEAGAAVPLVAGGTPVQVDATGRVVPRAGVAPNVGVGFALEAASGAGIRIAVLLTPRSAA